MVAPYERKGAELHIYVVPPRAAPSHDKAEKERAKPLSSLLPGELVLATFKTRDLSWLKVHWRAASRSICLPLV